MGRGDGDLSGKGGWEFRVNCGMDSYFEPAGDTNSTSLRGTCCLGKLNISS